MASQVLSGSSNVSYTNNTGQNVRIVINYMRGRTVSTSSGGYSTITISWGGASASAPITAIGRNLAFSVYDRLQSTGNTTIGQGTANTAASNAFIPSGTATFVSSASGNQTFAEGALPTELMLAPGQTFSATCEAYNVVIIPEAG